MPYSGMSDESLPEHVKKMPENMKKQWVEVFNSAIESGDDEGTAMKKANGVVKKEKDLIMNLYDIDKRQVMQNMAGYNSLGATSDKGCANCNWFIPADDACVLVAGDIVPTGLSNFWLEKQEHKMEPIIVKDTDLGISALVNRLKEWF